MPKKPTEPFGHIAFGRDGSVSKHMNLLSDQKRLQETEIANRFAVSISAMTGKPYEVLELEEANHDFWLVSGEEKIVVQATELVGRDYLQPLSLEDYREGRHDFTEFVYESETKIYGVDNEAKNRALAKKIQAKSSRYSKPKMPFWLLIWTVRSDFVAFFTANQEQRISPAVGAARAELTSTAGLFDEVWFFYPEVNAGRIWPV